MKNNFYISFGIWIAILPFLGIPGAWKNVLVTLSGLFLILVSIWPAIMKKLQTKPKSRKKKENNELRFSDPPSETLPPATPSL